MKWTITLGVATVLLFLGSVWWWALLGMSEEIAIALTVTCTVLGVLAVIAYPFEAW